MSRRPENRQQAGRPQYSSRGSGAPGSRANVWSAWILLPLLQKGTGCGHPTLLIAPSWLSFDRKQKRPGLFTQAFEQSLAFSTTAYGDSMCAMGVVEVAGAPKLQVGAVLATNGLGP